MAEQNENLAGKPEDSMPGFPKWARLTPLDKIGAFGENVKLELLGVASPAIGLHHFEGLTGIEKQSGARAQSSRTAAKAPKTKAGGRRGAGAKRKAADEYGTLHIREFEVNLNEDRPKELRNFEVDLSRPMIVYPVYVTTFERFSLNVEF